MKNPQKDGIMFFMEITVIRAKRKTLSLTVKRNGEIVVRAPLKTSEKAIEQFVNAHAEWINKRKTALNRNSLVLTDGAELLLFGTSVRIATGKKKTEFCNGTLYLPEENRESALIAYLKKLTRERMTFLTDSIAKRYGFSYASLRVSGARGRWGSCSRDGRISYSFRIAFLPEELIAAIAVHELCHTRHFNHSAAFWAEVEAIVPSYPNVRKALKSYEYVMNYL